MKISPYVYKITSSETGEFYIGSRYKNANKNLRPEEDLLIYYFTSSKLKDQIKRHPEKFIYSILFTYMDYNVCFWYEQLLIKEHINNPKCVNGQFVDPNTNSKIFSHSGSEEVRLKISKANKGKIRTPETRLKLSIASKNRKRASPSEETKFKISNTLKGRKRKPEDIFHYTYHTPFGIFNSLKDASKILNVDLSTISNLVSNKTKRMTKYTLTKMNLSLDLINLTPKEAGFYRL